MCSWLLYGRRFPLKLRGSVILYLCEAWCLKESEMKVLHFDGDIHDESNVRSTAQR